MSKMQQPSASASQSTAPRAGGRWMPLLLCAAVLLAYSNSLGVPFVFDDLPSIVDNPQIRGWAALLRPFADPGRVDITVSGRPVAAWSLALNHALGGLEVRGYHLLNLLIHAAAGLVLYGIVRRTLALPRWSSFAGEHRELWAAAAAMFFLLHPLQTQSVTYVVQRVESLAALWYLLVIYALLRAASGGDARRWSALAILCCALGMGTKEAMVSAPIAALLFDRCFLSGSFRAAWQARRGLHGGLAATWLLLAWLVATSPRLRVAGEAALEVGPLDYARIQAGAILRYFWLCVFPRDLVFDYGIVGDGVAIPDSAAGYAWQAAIVLLLCAASLWGLARNRAVGCLAVIGFLHLAPSSSVVPIRLEPIAEHRMYLPLALLAILWLLALTWLLSRLKLARDARLAAMLCIAFALALGARTFARNHDYRSALALWEDTANKRPGNARALTNLGLEVEKTGDQARAIALHREALIARPGYSEAHHNLARSLLLAGQLAEAEASYRRALALSPEAVETRVGLAECLVRSARLDEAAVEFEQALALRADLYGAHRSLAAIRLQQQRLDESAAHFVAALRLDGSDPKLWNLLGTIHAQQGRYDLAVESFSAALRVQPGFPDALSNLERLKQLRSGR